MGLLPSAFTLEGVASVVVAFGLVSLYFLRSNSSSEESSIFEKAQNVGQDVSKRAKGKKSKKKTGSGQDKVVEPSGPVEQTVPGGNDLFAPSQEPIVHDTDDLVASLDTGKAAKEKRKKAKKPATTITTPITPAATTEAGGRALAGKAAANPRPSVRTSNAPATDEGLWTKVERSRKTSTVTTNTEASMTTVAATEPSSVGSTDYIGLDSSSPGSNRKTLVEKLTPKVRKTAVDDMIEGSEESLSRVMRIVSGEEHESPIPTESLDSEGDFGVASGVGGISGTDEEGFVAVGRGRRRPLRASSGGSAQGQPRAPESMNKKQRQNAMKREREKANQDAADQERLERLAQHRREQTKARIEEQYKRAGKGKGLSGGMSMGVDGNGKGIWT